MPVNTSLLSSEHQVQAVEGPFKLGGADPAYSLDEQGSIYGNDL